MLPIGGYPAASGYPDPYTPPTGVFEIDGDIYVKQTAATSGTPTSAIKVDGAAHTGLAIAEATDVNYNLARTVTFGAGGGTLSTQRAAVYQAPTYAAASSLTITDAATLAITGAPSAGSNVTITNAHALLVQGGPVTFTSTGPHIRVKGSTGAGLEFNSDAPADTNGTDFLFKNTVGRSAGSHFPVMFSFSNNGASVLNYTYTSPGFLNATGYITASSGIQSFDYGSFSGSSGITLHGDLVAAATGTDVVLKSTNTRTAGKLVAFQNASTVKGFVNWEGRLFYTVPNSAPTDGDLLTSSLTWYLVEGSNTLQARIKYSDGTLKSLTTALALS